MAHVASLCFQFLENGSTTRRKPPLNRAEQSRIAPPSVAEVGNMDAKVKAEFLLSEGQSALLCMDPASLGGNRVRLRKEAPYLLRP